MASDDVYLAAEALSRAHGGHWAEHPDYQSHDWRLEVINQETRQGYWFWVVARIAEENKK